MYVFAIYCPIIPIQNNCTPPTKVIMHANDGQPSTGSPHTHFLIIIKIIAIKDISHIALFFVDGRYHNQGIGRKLYNKVELLNNKGYFTVNSSPYAHEIYKHFGFIDTDTEQCFKGLRFYPMKKDIERQ